MVSTIIRLRSGDSIQVRTGTIQGIGPQGPTGATGAIGPAGPAGEQGTQGDVGYVDESAVFITSVAPYQSVAPTTNTWAQMNTVVLDDFNARQSVDTFNLPVGNYTFYANAKFTKSSGTQSGFRLVRLVMAGVTQWETTCASVAVSGVTYTALTLSGGLYVTDPDADIQLQVWHNDSVSLALDTKFWASRVGAGMPGPQGEQGPQGPVGATGATGSQGPAGTIGNNNTTFGDLGG